MTSLIDSLAANEKTVIIIDIGQAYTKCGFAGNVSPRYIIPTSITSGEITKHVFERNSDFTVFDDDHLSELIQSIYYKYNVANSRGRRVVIVESIIMPTRIRHLIANILLKQLEALSVAFISSHLAATYTLGRNTVLVLDVGYREAQIMPIAECVPLAMRFDSLACAGQAIHKHIQYLLEQHATITYRGKRQLFNVTQMKLSDETLEDIKVRCCFISPFIRAHLYAENKFDSDPSTDSFKEASSIDYCVNSDATIHIPGVVREFACEILFEQNIDEKCLTTLILDTLLQSPMDLRRELAQNILVIGGTAMIPGFLHRLNAELLHLVNTSKYAKKLTIKQFRFHSPPSQLNYTAWLGGSIFGTLDILEAQSISRDQYLSNGILPDWFTDKETA